MKSNPHKLLFNKQLFTSKGEWGLEQDNICIENKFCETGRSSIFVDEDNFYKLINIAIIQTIVVASHLRQAARFILVQLLLH